MIDMGNDTNTIQALGIKFWLDVVSERAITDTAQTSQMIEDLMLLLNGFRLEDHYRETYLDNQVEILASGLQFWTMALKSMNISDVKTCQALVNYLSVSLNIREPIVNVKLDTKHELVDDFDGFDDNDLGCDDKDDEDFKPVTLNIVRKEKKARKRRRMKMNDRKHVCLS